MRRCVGAQRPILERCVPERHPRRVYPLPPVRRREERVVDVLFAATLGRQTTAGGADRCCTHEVRHAAGADRAEVQHVHGPRRLAEQRGLQRVQPRAVREAPKPRALADAAPPPPDRFALHLAHQLHPSGAPRRQPSARWLLQLVDVVQAPKDLGAGGLDLLGVQAGCPAQQHVPVPCHRIAQLRRLGERVVGEFVELGQQAGRDGAPRDGDGHGAGVGAGRDRSRQQGKTEGGPRGKTEGPAEIKSGRRDHGHHRVEE